MAKKTAARADAAKKSAEPEKLKRKAYDEELRRLHAELVKLQQWVVHKGLKVCIVFEGRDGAGKGGTIKAITDRVSPRVFRVVALPAPTERQKTQMYMQRYVPHLPAAGEVVIFDRSWYNRAGVERVMGFASDAQVKRFLILHKELDADDGEVTRTQKVRRGFVAERYAALVKALYDGSKEADISTEVTFEDGRKGVLSARVKVRDVATVPVAPTLGKAA